MNDYLVLARELHRYYPVADAHLDLPAVICRLNRAGESHITEKYFLKDFQSASLNLLGASIYLSTSELESGSRSQALAQIEALKRDIEPLYPDVCLVTTAAGLDKALEDKRLGIFLYFEGLEPAEGCLSFLDEAYRLGVRGASLTWSRLNAFATGCCPADEWEDKRGGLTADGRRALKKLEELGMFLDISHLNDDGITDVECLSSFPYLATHSNSRTVCRSYRNLTDAQLLRLTNRGGLTGINAYKGLVFRGISRDPVEEICRHILYIRRLAGASHICYGLDLCDLLTASAGGLNAPVSHGDCIQNHSQLPLITAKLLKLNLPVEETVGILGQNLADYLRRSFARGEENKK